MACPLLTLQPLGDARQVLQALEGPEDAVKTLYAKIALDSRHTDCQIIKQEQVKTSQLSPPPRDIDCA